MAGKFRIGTLLIFYLLLFFHGMSSNAKPIADQASTISFSGMRWEIETTFSAPVNPGQNYFSARKDSLWVDEQGWLHLKIHNHLALPKWTCAAIHSVESAKYGLHRFQVIGRLGALDKNVVLGLFLYQSTPTNKGTLPAEIDFEFSTWGLPKYLNDEWINACSNAQTVLWPSQWDESSVQPADIQYYFIHSPEIIQTTHEICWEENAIGFQSFWYHDAPPRDENLIFSYSTEQKRNPSAYFPIVEDEMKIHINLWLNNDTLLPSDGQAEEILVKYEFIPLTESD